MKKICIFSSYLLPHLGGVERYTDKVLKQLKKDYDVEITIVTCSYKNAPYIKEYEGCTVYTLPTFNVVSNRYPIIKFNKTYRRIFKELNNIEFDAYICQTRFYLLSQIGAKLAKKHNKSPIIIEHGSCHFSVGNRLLDFFGAIYEHYLTSRLKRCNAKFYGVSKRCNEWLKHFKINAQGVFYNSVDDNCYELYKDNHFINDKKNKIIISYVGRIMVEKGTEMLVNVFEHLEKDYSNIELYLAGDGPLLSNMQKRHNNKKIHYCGKLEYNQVMSLLNDSDIFVHPSMYPEGLPTSILEAGIMKNAIIATDRGGTVEVINDNKYGIIMEENEESLYNSLNNMLRSKNIEQYQKNIYSRVMDNFTWKNTAKKIMEEIENGKEN